MRSNLDFKNLKRSVKGCIKMDLKYLNIKDCNNIYRNMSVSQLTEFIIKRGEGTLSDKGSVVINTGKYTGRSAHDRFIVEDDITTGTVNWGGANLPVDEQVFDKLYDDVVEYLRTKDLFVFDGFIGAVKEWAIPIRVVCENACQAMFSNQMFIRPNEKELSDFLPGFHVISAPGFKAKGKEDGVNSESFIIINFSKKIIIIGGTAYSGEIKKAVFTVMNFILPQKGVLPMHCSANIGKDGKTSVFFGLSGTGKTTLSTDPERKLIGDDEHGWCDEGVFNFEGGCYAKTIGLDKEKEKEIYNAVKFGTVLENVVLNENGEPDYNSDIHTVNTRAAYPINYVDNIQETGIGGNPSTIIFLTADAFGVMPPISKLNTEEAIYHFMSGYTSKVSGTERGVTEPQATFSACFGEPFMLLNPMVYANLLGEKIKKYDIDVYLINTGYIGGSFGKGKRMKLAYTRAMVNAAISGEMKNSKFYQDPVFGFLIPEECPGVPADILNPRNNWDICEEYDKKALMLKKKIALNSAEKFDMINIPEAKHGGFIDFLRNGKPVYSYVNSNTEPIREMGVC
jgi:phosphoenolpyruvate carboxykinase (ATP)